jgi:DNA modification methylase
MQAYPLGKNPGDVVGYESKYRGTDYGQLPQGFVRDDSIAKMRAQSRLDAEELYPGDPVKQQEYVNWVHDHGGHPLGANPGDFWTINTKPFKAAHFAVFPEQLCVRPILSSCPPEGTVFDPMCGSGTTLVVAKRLGRHFIGIDVNPAYCEMAQRRLATVPPPLTRFVCPG